MKLVNRKRLMMATVIASTFVAGIVVALITGWISNLSTDTKILSETCQPNTVDYSNDGRRFCVQLRSRERGWGFHSDRELWITSNNVRGVLVTDELIASEGKVDADWGDNGVTLINAHGIKLFVPARIFARGR